MLRSKVGTRADYEVNQILWTSVVWRVFYLSFATNGWKEAITGDGSLSLKISLYHTTVAYVTRYQIKVMTRFRLLISITRPRSYRSSAVRFPRFILRKVPKNCAARLSSRHISLDLGPGTGVELRGWHKLYIF